MHILIPSSQHRCAVCIFSCVFVIWWFIRCQAIAQICGLPLTKVYEIAQFLTGRTAGAKGCDNYIRAPQNNKWQCSTASLVCSH